jgi:hypothetical protein
MQGVPNTPSSGIVNLRITFMRTKSDHLILRGIRCREIGHRAKGKWHDARECSSTSEWGDPTTMAPVPLGFPFLSRGDHHDS